MIRKVRNFLNFPPRLRQLLIEAWLNLGRARLTLLTREFRAIAPTLGTHQKEASPKAGETQTAAAREVGWAVRLISRHTLWESKCFAQAIAARRMLTKRGIHSTLYFGTALNGNGKLIAHAWVKSCGLTLTGGENAGQFTVVSIFGD